MSCNLILIQFPPPSLVFRLRRYVSDHTTNNEVRHLNDDLVAACHAVALNRPAATAAALRASAGSGAASAAAAAMKEAALPVHTGRVRLVFKGNRVFVFHVITPELPMQLECIRWVLGEEGRGWGMFIFYLFD